MLKVFCLYKHVKDFSDEVVYVSPYPYLLEKRKEELEKLIPNSLEIYYFIKEANFIS